MRYRLLKDTGDLKIKVYGRTYTEIFNNAVYAMSMSIIKVHNPKIEVEKNIELHTNNYESLLINLLNDVLFYFETQDTLFFNSKLNVDDFYVVTGKLLGMHIPEKVNYEYIIKAATYHDLEIMPDKNHAIIVFDI
ncbi:archease [Acidiplasma sp.]|uniref:archease n=1 Tax=Acidiplasma sp. TaxID=1872114 RepID=UPI0025898341|nr:archease [Acidiplasma sp.]